MVQPISALRASVEEISESFSDLQFQLQTKTISELAFGMLYFMFNAALKTKNAITYQAHYSVLTYPIAHFAYYILWGQDLKRPQRDHANPKLSLRDEPENKSKPKELAITSENSELSSFFSPSSVAVPSDDEMSSRSSSPVNLVNIENVCWGNAYFQLLIQLPIELLFIDWFGEERPKDELEELIGNLDKHVQTYLGAQKEGKLRLDKEFSKDLRKKLLKIMGLNEDSILQQDLAELDIHFFSKLSKAIEEYSALKNEFCSDITILQRDPITQQEDITFLTSYGLCFGCEDQGAIIPEAGGPQRDLSYWIDKFYNDPENGTVRTVQKAPHMFRVKVSRTVQGEHDRKNEYPLNLPDEVILTRGKEYLDGDETSTYRLSGIAAHIGSLNVEDEESTPGGRPSKRVQSAGHYVAYPVNIHNGNIYLCDDIKSKVYDLDAGDIAYVRNARERTVLAFYQKVDRPL